MDLTKKIFDKQLREMADDFTQEDWIQVLTNQTLSEQFLRDYSPVFTKYKLWSVLTEKQNMTEDFMRDFVTKIDWAVAQSQNISCEFLDTLPRLKIRKKISVKVKGQLDNFSDEQLQEIWEGLKYNERAKLENKSEINVLAYASSSKTVDEMKQIRKQLIEEIENQEYMNISIDNLLQKEVDDKLMDVPKQNMFNNKRKKHQKPLNTPYGEIKILPNGVYEYPQKEYHSYESADNEFGECKIF